MFIYNEDPKPKLLNDVCWFHLQYPMYTTNPKKVTAPNKNSGVASIDKLLSFNNIEYPGKMDNLLHPEQMASIRYELN